MGKAMVKEKGKFLPEECCEHYSDSWYYFSPMFSDILNLNKNSLLTAFI